MIQAHVCLHGALAFFVFACAGVHAQSYGRVEQTQSNLNSYYYLVEPGAQTIRIYVTGPVRYPGMYEVSKGSDLRKVLALCGGPDPGRVEFTNRQRTTVRLYRGGDAEGKCVYESPLEKAVARIADAPALMEGDVITVDVAAWRRFDWRDILTIVSVINTVVLIILAAQNIGT